MELEERPSLGKVTIDTNPSVNLKRFLITGWLLSDKVKLETMHCMDVCLSEQEERPS